MFLSRLTCFELSFCKHFAFCLSCTLRLCTSVEIEWSRESGCRKRRAPCISQLEHFISFRLSVAQIMHACDSNFDFYGSTAFRFDLARRNERSCFDDIYRQGNTMFQPKSISAEITRISNLPRVGALTRALGLTMVSFSKRLLKCSMDRRVAAWSACFWLHLQREVMSEICLSDCQIHARLQSTLVHSRSFSTDFALTLFTRANKMTPSFSVTVSCR